MELNPDFVRSILCMKNRRNTDMKKLILIAWALLGAGSLETFAQRAESPCPRLEKGYAWMKDSLGLNASQQQQISGFRDEACRALKTAKAEAGEDRELLKSKAKEILKHYHSQVRSVLSSEQIDKLEARQKAVRKEVGKGAKTPEKRASRMTATMKEKLALTADQEKTVAEANLTLVQKVETQKEQLQQGGDTAAARAAVKQARMEHDAAVRTVLTPDQLKRWDAIKAEMREKKKHHKAGK